ncbi:hypothetical protein LCGC14_1332190, partial [marine sediment metagenome]
ITTTDNTPFVGEIIDMRGFKSMVFAILVGVNTDADATFVVLIEEDDAGGFGTATSVADVNLDPTEAVASFDFADDDTVRKIGYTGEKRYVRMTITPADNAAGNIYIAAIAIMGEPDRRPTTAQAT